MSVIAERVWNMIVETYGDNLYERESDSSIVYESRWKRDMIQGIERILAEEMAGPLGDDTDTLAAALAALRDMKPSDISVFVTKEGRAVAYLSLTDIAPTVYFYSGDDIAKANRYVVALGKALGVPVETA